MSKAYPSNLTPDQFDLLNDWLPAAKPGGRPREVDLWAVLNALFYLLCEGCRWRALPGDFPAIARRAFKKGRRCMPIFATGVKTALGSSSTITYGSGYVSNRHANRVPPCGKQATEAIIDSQSVKSAAMVSASVGWGGGKLLKGRKRFLTVDTLGLGLRVWVTAANVGEREGGKRVLKRVNQRGQAVSRLHTIWVDGGFDGEPFMQWVMDGCRWIVQVVLRPEQTKGFVLLKKRWVVERTFGWLMATRRLVRDDELLPETSETLIDLAMIRIMVRRLA